MCVDGISEYHDKTKTKGTTKQSVHSTEFACQLESQISIIGQLTLKTTVIIFFFIFFSLTSQYLRACMLAAYLHLPNCTSTLTLIRAGC